MTHKEFDKRLKQRLEQITKTLSSKSAEYSTLEDKMHNFKKTARMRDSHPCTCLQGFMDKHLTSYFDILKRIEAGQDVSQNVIEEKIGDIICYFLLQENLFFEQNCLDDEERLLFMQGRK